VAELETAMQQYGRPRSICALSPILFLNIRTESKREVKLVLFLGFCNKGGWLAFAALERSTARVTEQSKKQ